jgi:hypothetical protein
VPVTVLRPSLHELADILGECFRIACLADFRFATDDDYAAAASDYQAEHKLSDAKMREILRHGCPITNPEIRERAQLIMLMRLYARHWRPDQPDGPRVRLPSRQPKPASRERPRKRATTSKSDEAQLTGGVNGGVKPARSAKTSAIINA